MYKLIYLLYANLPAIYYIAYITWTQLQIHNQTFLSSADTWFAFDTYPEQYHTNKNRNNNNKKQTSNSRHNFFNRESYTKKKMEYVHTKSQYAVVTLIWFVSIHTCLHNYNLAWHLLALMICSEVYCVLMVWTERHSGCNHWRRVAHWFNHSTAIQTSNGNVLVASTITMIRHNVHSIFFCTCSQSKVLILW